MKKPALLFALLVIAIVGIIAYAQYRQRALMADLTRETDAIAAGYKTLADRDLRPLAATHALTDGQSAAVQTVAQRMKDPAATQPLAQKVADIHDVQMALVRFLRDVTPTQPFAQSAELADLQKEMGKDGRMRGLLDAYNQTAKEWNDTQSTGVTMLTSDILRKKSNPLPYLRFDGEMEYFTVIHL
ncbi:MAG TPA: hypothetical protein VHA78_01625 [Candidatus Peribacteraceae bacterium]|nr:hypothetical protein [Candidatus Peribacteraceae bacterium]